MSADINLLSRITLNPDVMLGKPTIRGLRITVEQVIEALAGGVNKEELLEDYPELQEEDIKAVLQYANESVKSEKVYAVEL